MVSIRSTLFSIDVRVPGSAVVIAVAGQLDMATAPQLAVCLDAAVGSTDDDVILDVRGLRYIDSSGLNLLVATRARLTAAGRRLELAHVGHRIAHVLHLTGLEDVFDVNATGATR